MMEAGSRALALLAAALIAGCGGATPGSGPPPSSTLEATLVDRDGDGALERGPGEPLRDRADFGGRGARGDVLATFAQLTDTHVRDEESPARVPFLDRLGAPFNSTFRPQEALSAQVLAASVRALDRLHPQAVAVTGDIVDNAQANELDLARAVLDGGRVRPDSGATGYDGIQEATNPDPLVYRPDNDAPRHPGLLDRAQRPFVSPGLGAPWYPAVGNHDLLVQGETPPTPRIDAFAAGGRAIQGLGPGLRPREGVDSAAAVDALLSHELPGRERTVPADRHRRLLAPAELLAHLGRPVHGGRLDYGFDIGAAVRAIVLDTANRRGGSRGELRPRQVRWLRTELARAGRRWVVVFVHNPLETSDGGQAALAVLDRAPRVVAVVSGNRHRNVIAPHREGGYWLIGTSSLADFPQQARAFRLLRTAAGGVALETWMVDHDGAGLAGIARELAFLDAQGGRPQRFAGAPADRNARLYVPAAR
jgi:3',5'-cyclic AMP phosphodiesterase CpdA